MQQVNRFISNYGIKYQCCTSSLEEIIKIYGFGYAIFGKHHQKGKEKKKKKQVSFQINSGNAQFSTRSLNTYGTRVYLYAYVWYKRTIVYPEI